MGDITENMMGPTKLCEKYSTMAFVIRQFADVNELQVAPEDLSKYPDFPKRLDDMSTDEYQEIIKRYYKTRKNKIQRKNRQKKKATELNSNGKETCKICNIDFPNQPGNLDK